MTSNQEQAKLGEDLAAAFLTSVGMNVIERNYRYGHGELDIIAQDEAYIVFVEVKTRRSASFGPPEYAVTISKQRQLMRVAQGYLVDRELSDTPCRFDVVTVSFDRGRPEINHIPNAFSIHP